MANTKKRWTADEIEILRKYYPAEGDQVCERLSGRTAKSCRIQASKMEISKNISSSATVQNDVKYVRYGQRQRIKYSESIMLRRAVRYVIA